MLHLFTHPPINSSPFAMPSKDGPGNWPTQGMELGQGPFGQVILGLFVSTAWWKGVICRVLVQGPPLLSEGVQLIKSGVGLRARFPLH